jgi:hypothetical protein
MVLEIIFYVLFWMIFVLLIEISIHFVKVSKGEGLSLLFGTLLFLLLLLALKPQLHGIKPIEEILISTVKFDWATFIIGGVVLGGIGFLSMHYFKRKSTIAKALSSGFIFLALLFGVSLIWMNHIAVFMSNALLGALFVGIFVYLFLKKD